MAFALITRRPSADWASGDYTLLDNELGIESHLVNGIEVDTGKAKLGDGITTWANLPYFSPNASTAGPASSTSGDIATFSGATGKVLQDGGMSLPASSGTVGYLNIPQNSQSAAYVLVAADSGKHIYHPVGDNNARQFTIPANATVPFALGTAITIVNMAATSSTLIITTDTLNYVNVGAVTTVTIPQYNEVTILKITTTSWLCSGSAGVTTA